MNVSDNIIYSLLEMDEFTVYLLSTTTVLVKRYWNIMTIIKKGPPPTPFINKNYELKYYRQNKGNDNIFTNSNISKVIFFVWFETDITQAVSAYII